MTIELTEQHKMAAREGMKGAFEICAQMAEKMSKESVYLGPEGQAALLAFSRAIRSNTEKWGG